MANITHKSQRERLKIRREPYWHRLQEGQYLGYRRGADTWIARYRDPAGRQHYQSLAGVVDFDDAKASAEKWLKTISRGGTAQISRGTVREALNAYVESVRDSGRSTHAIEMHLVHALRKGSAFAALPLERLTKGQFKAWRDSLKPGRLARTVNRHARQVQAGLTHAVRECGYVGNREAWALKPLHDTIESDPSEASVFLTAVQRSRLIANAEPDAALFMRGLELTGARPGELAAAVVADFDAKLGKLKLSTAKGNGELRSRHAKLSTAAVAFFAAQCKDKLPRAPIFVCTATGEAWSRHMWGRAFAAARDEANTLKEGQPPVPPAERIPAEASAYSFRHAWISEALSLRAIDPVTAAKLTGTSMTMIYKHYAKFIDDSILEKLDAVTGTQP